MTIYSLTIMLSIGLGDFLAVPGSGDNLAGLRGTCCGSFVLLLGLTSVAVWVNRRRALEDKAALVTPYNDPFDTE